MSAPAPNSAPQKAAIMQPTFLPWCGYFALMASVDLFIFLDDVQFDKRSWQQRNRIKTPNGIVWLTVPVMTKGLRGQTIAEARIQPDAKFPDAMWRTIEMTFAKAPFANRYLPELHDIMTEDSDAFAEAGLSLAYFDYTHPEHAQLHGPFEPYMSALDLLVNEGPRAGDIVRAGIAS